MGEIIVVDFKSREIQSRYQMGVTPIDVYFSVMAYYASFFVDAYEMGMWFWGRPPEKIRLIG